MLSAKPDQTHSGWPEAQSRARNRRGEVIVCGHAQILFELKAAEMEE